MKPKFVIKGDVEMRRKLVQASKKTPEIFADAGFDEMKVEEKEARKRTPVDKGNLVETVEAQKPEIKGKTISVSLTAGGAEAPYAEFVHEDPDAYHRVGEWKFIESTLNESQDHMAARIGKRIDLRKALR